MQDNNKLDEPMKELRKELNFHQPSEKPSNDVLESENSGANAKSQFVHSTQQEMNRIEEDPAVKKPVSGNTETNSGSSMPATERLTEND